MQYRPLPHTITCPPVFLLHSSSMPGLCYFPSHFLPYFLFFPKRSKGGEIGFMFCNPTWFCQYIFAWEAEFGSATNFSESSSLRTLYFPKSQRTPLTVMERSQFQPFYQNRSSRVLLFVQSSFLYFCPIFLSLSCSLKSLNCACLTLPAPHPFILRNMNWRLVKSFFLC